VAKTQSEAAVLQHRAVIQSESQRLRHRIARAADAETQRRPPEPTMLKHKPLQLAVKADIVKSATHVAETARELRC
jgi:hypothetical protein